MLTFLGEISLCLDASLKLHTEPVL